ncbi:hypothetical protein APY03_3135 [Variovorax sp. WDL1]|nr:hypothetical protein APY03_3135 [Variovorax sp. WDL1]
MFAAVMLDVQQCGKVEHMLCVRLVVDQVIIKRPTEIGMQRFRNGLTMTLGQIPSHEGEALFRHGDA